MSVKIEGLSGIITKLRLLNSNAGKGCERGLKKGGLVILRESQKEVPVDLGNLRGSGFTRKVSGNGFDADVIVGYTADYAIYVHEDKDAKHGSDFNTAYADEIASSKSKVKSRGEGQKAKFLEDPAKRNRKLVLFLVKQGVEQEVDKL